MAIGIYLNATTGGTDGTLEVAGNGSGVTLGNVGSVGTFHLRAANTKENAEAVTVTAPTDCEVSKDNSTYASSVEYAIGSISYTNTVCYIKRIAYTNSNSGLITGLVTTPRLSSITERLAPAAPNAFTPTVSNITTTSCTVTFSTTDPNGDALTYKVAVTTSATAPTDWSGYSNQTSPYSATGLTAGTTYYAHVRAFDGTFATIGTSAAFSSVLSGTGTSGDPYLVTSVSDWNYVADNYTNYAASYLKIANDINAGGATLRALGTQTGSLDGNSKTLSNFLVQPATGNARLINTVKEVKNLTLSDYTIDADVSGGWASPFYNGSGGSLTNVRSLNATIKANGASGRAYGFIAIGDGVTVSGCAVNGGSVTGTARAVGFTNGSTSTVTNITNCYVRTTISSSTGCYGFAYTGMASDTLTNCYSACALSGTATTKQAFGAVAVANKANFADVTVAGTTDGTNNVVQMTTTQMKSGDTGTGGIANTSTGLPSGVGSGKWTFPASAYPELV